MKSTTWAVQPTNPRHHPVFLEVTTFAGGNVCAKSIKHSIEVYAKDLDALDHKVRAIVSRIFGGKYAKRSH
jgi:hypothetical protein